MRILLLMTLGFSCPALGESLADQEWFAYMADINRGSALESPGSKGSLSLNVAAGLQSQPAPETSSRYTDQMRPLSSKTADSLHFVSVHKGTPWPLDLGVSFGQTGDGDVKRVGGNLQWTWLEVPKGISLSTRAGFYRTDGFATASIETKEIVAMIGAGHSYVSIYALGGLADHLATLDSTKKNWQQPVAALGIQTRLGTPLLTATVEWVYRDESYRGLSAKLAVGI